MRSVGAAGFPRGRAGTVGEGGAVLSDLEINSQISAPLHAA